MNQQNETEQLEYSEKFLKEEFPECFNTKNIFLKDASVRMTYMKIDLLKRFVEKFGGIPEQDLSIGNFNIGSFWENYKYNISKKYIIKNDKLEGSPILENDYSNYRFKKTEKPRISKVDFEKKIKDYIRKTSRPNPTTSSITNRLNQNTSSTTSRLNPITSSITNRLNPNTSSTTSRLNPNTSSTTSRLNPTTSSTTNRQKQTTRQLTSRDLAELLFPNKKKRKRSYQSTTSSSTMNPLNPNTSSTMNPLNPTTSSTMNRLNPNTSSTMNRLNPTTSSTMNRLNPNTSSITNRLNPNTSSTTSPLNPITSSRMNTLNPNTSSTTSPLNPITSSTTSRLNPITSSIKTKTPVKNNKKMYGIKFQGKNGIDTVEEVPENKIKKIEKQVTSRTRSGNVKKQLEIGDRVKVLYSLGGTRSKYFQGEIIGIYSKEK